MPKIPIVDIRGEVIKLINTDEQIKNALISEASNLLKERNNEKMSMTEKIIDNETLTELLETATVQTKKKLIDRGEYFAKFMIDDENPIIRSYIAEKGFFLEELSKDPDWRVRKDVISTGYLSEDILNTMIDDPNPFVRLEIVNRKFKLDHFAKDSDPLVRVAVIIADGYYANKFLNDECEYVRKLAKEMDKKYKAEVFGHYDS